MHEGCTRPAREAWGLGTQASAVVSDENHRLLSITTTNIRPPQNTNS